MTAYIPILSPKVANQASDDLFNVAKMGEQAHVFRFRVEIHAHFEVRVDT